MGHLKINLVKCLSKLFLQYHVVLDAQAPVKTKTIITKHAPWIKDEVLDHIKERNRLRKESMKEGKKTVEAWNAYKKQRNLTTKIIRKAKRDRISDIVTNKFVLCPELMKMKTLLNSKSYHSFLLSQFQWTAILTSSNEN